MLIENKESFFQLPSLSGNTYKQAFQKDPASGHFPFFYVSITLLMTLDRILDTLLTILVVENPAAAVGCLNTDLGKISRWAALWPVSFNPVKNEALQLFRKRNKPYHPPVFMENHQITEVESHKPLGVYLRMTVLGTSNLNILSSVRAWNSLPNEAKQCNSVNSFKYYLKRDTIQTQKYFYFGSRKAQILYTRLRTKCSSLNLDLFHKTLLSLLSVAAVELKIANISSFTADFINCNALNFLTHTVPEPLLRCIIICCLSLTLAIVYHL